MALSFSVSVSLEAKASPTEEASAESYVSVLSPASAAKASSGTSFFFIFTATFLALVALAGDTSSPASLVFDLALLAVVLSVLASDAFVVFLAFVATADSLAVLFFSFSIVPPRTIAPHCHLSLIRLSHLWSQSGSLVAS